jgi:membrane-associated phospholipid phosphatase
VKGYTFVDYITQGYLALVGALIFLFHASAVPAWPLLVGLHLVTLSLIHGMLVLYAKRPEVKPIAFLRHFYPVLLYAGFYSETGRINQMFFNGYLDPVVIRWDQALFGCQPSLAFMEDLPFLPVSELFYASYFSYYIMIGGVGLALYLRDRRQFFHYVSVVSFVFYICYLIYIFLPVIGPPIFFEKIFNYSLPAELQRLAPPGGFPPAVKDGLFYRLMKWIYQVFESPGAAIPSSHVAVALCTVFFSFRYLRLIRWAHLIVATLLCLATVYCRYHYVCDVLAGIAAALVLIPLGNHLFLRFGKPKTTKASQELSAVRP